MSEVLKGVRVVEQGTFITGPAAGMMLADLGADVIKVEQPETGDPFRGFESGLYSAHFQAYNRNKRSIALDVTAEKDRAIFHDLIGSADVYIQNFRPGSAEKLGVGEEAMRKLNPKLIYCAITGFSDSGPYKLRPSYDTVAQAFSGFLHLLVNPENPRVVGPAIADAITGFYAAYGILGALVERGRTGIGKSLGVSMLESMSHFNIDAFAHYFAHGEIMGPYSRPSASQSYVLRCADDRWIALHMSSPKKFWDGLAEVIERPSMFEDARFASRPARIENHEVLIGELGTIFKGKKREEWIRLLEAKDVPHAPVYRTDEVLSDPQFKHLRIEVEGRHPVQGQFRSVRNPVIYNHDRTSSVTPPPLLDEHREAILREIKR